MLSILKFPVELPRLATTGFVSPSSLCRESREHMGSRDVVLIAEDEVMIRNTARHILQEDGYEILFAADGGEALKISRNHSGNIDLLLTDVEMPNLDGISVFRQIVRERPDIRLLLMSGSTSARLEIPDSLCFLPKPFDPPGLRSKVREALGSRPPTVAAQKTILVVDHDETRRERTKGILRTGGYLVLIASSTEEAEQISDSFATIDLIVSGVLFPGQSGVHLAEHVEASDREISTLLISHFYPDVLKRVPGFPRQPEFLQNPFTADELLARVRRLLQ